MKKALENSLWQTANNFAVTGINLLLIVGYTRVLSPQAFGSLVTSQAKVLLWIFLVDLGLFHGLIALLTKLNADRNPEGAALGERLVWGVLRVRLLAAGLAGLCILFTVDRSLGWQDMAFIPHLFAFGAQQTITPYAIFLGQLRLTIVANLIGIGLSAGLGFSCALLGFSVSQILVVQSGGPFIAALIIFAGIRRADSKSVVTIQTPMRQLWQALFVQSWPYAVFYASSTIWTRFDQIAASYFLGYESGGRYALAVRLAAVPVAVTAAVSGALFADAQRVGRDNPQKLLSYSGVLAKLVFWWGLPAILIALAILAWIGASLFPAYSLGIQLLFGFAPGIWALWINIFVCGALFGMDQQHRAVRLHVLASASYFITTIVGAKYLGLAGIVLGYNVYCIALFGLGYWLLHRLTPRDLRVPIFSASSRAEQDFWRDAREKFGYLKK